MSAAEKFDTKGDFEVTVQCYGMKSFVKERVFAPTMNEALKVVTQRYGCDADILNIVRLG